MSKFVVDLSKENAEDARQTNDAPVFSAALIPAKRSRFGKILKIFGLVVLTAAVVFAVGGFFYWQNLKSTPQYSLALLVEAARNNDEEKVAEFVDSDAVIDDFLPQITEKAVELYGRGLPPGKIERISKVVVPILPAVKDRARAELPNLIREKTSAFERFPFWAIAIGAGKFIDIQIKDGKALIKNKTPERNLELTMKQNGDHWQVIAVKDEALAQRIAEKVGQEIIGIAKQNGSESLKNSGESLGIDNVKDLIKKAEDIFK